MKTRLIFFLWASEIVTMGGHYGPYKITHENLVNLFSVALGKSYKYMDLNFLPFANLKRTKII